MRVTFRWLFAVAVFAAPTAAQAAPVPAVPAKADNPMTAVRKALDEVGDMTYQARTLLDVVNDIKEKSKLPVILDSGLANFGLDINQPTVTVNLKQVKLKDGLKAVLDPYNLKFGLTREGLFISNEEGVTARQLRQRVSVDCDGNEFATAIKQLATDTGANVVVDPRLADKAKKAVALKLEDVPLETAIRLLAEVADLRAVRMSNVLFITTPEKAKVLREDADGPTAPTPANQVFPFGPNGPPIPGGFGGAQILPVAPAAPAVEAPAVQPAPAPAPAAPEKK
ncbi:MAG: hypothetical protein K8U57_30195 [Planctomycetes bacterium]|nr:hypothetical protein [Planctomycetota bacterium]